MNVRSMIDAAVSTLERENQARMRAAMELGARFALEFILSESSYNTDAKKALADLDGKSQMPRQDRSAQGDGDLGQPDPVEEEKTTV